MNKSQKHHTLCILRDYLKAEANNKPADAPTIEAALSIVETSLMAPGIAKATADAPAPAPIPVPIPAPTGDPSVSQILQVILEIIQILIGSGVIKAS